ncbi:hypothetical protein GWI33_015284 [Rhynchophorus ferrugineus]|uniref:Kinesin-like protein n=1 Tax=Rhynchophorus ferrugineus TaxID=354439 RepID=A0A834I028_RHYFE|nr:hypothetical protein GWI33_015284 [Rhynchophorus ferrugineus]
MVKCDKNLKTPRRRTSAKSSVTAAKVSKALSQPATSTVPNLGRVSNMTVVVRVRPPNKKEQEQNSRIVVKTIDDKMLIFDPKEEEQPFFYHGVKHRDFLKRGNKELKFVFDKVCGNISTNVEVYTHSTKSLVDTLMNGYNCSVFAYGATGAGKTYTMIGTEESPGITFLTMQDLFNRKNELSSEREFELMVTYVEIYNEVVKDLLCSNGSPLYLREDSKYGVIISGVKAHKISNPGELFSLLDQGNKRRTQHLTDANAESSRSHAVFQVYIHMTCKNTRESSTAKLSMIDLAGSERGSATGYVGPRFKEGANINRSLLALGNCINSLINGKNHIPYRDSKLTRLLKDSLGGNCHTVMIANVSPSSLSYEETYNTLKYAYRAKSIKSNIKKNVISGDLHVEQYIKLVSDLQTENAHLKSEVERLKQEKTHCDDGDSSELDALRSENNEMKKQIELLNLTINALRSVKSEGKGDGPCPSEDLSKVRTEVYQEFAVLVKDQTDALQSIFEMEKSIVAKKKQIDTELALRSTGKGKDDKKKISDKYDKEEKDLKLQIERLKSIKMRTSVKIKNLLLVYPELNQEYEKFSLNMDRLEFQYQNELTQMKNDILRQMLTDFQKEKHPLSQSANMPGTSSACGTVTRPKRNLQDAKGKMNSTFVLEGGDKPPVKTKTTRNIAVKGFKTRSSKRFLLGTTSVGKENKPGGSKLTLSYDVKKIQRKRWV